MAADPRMFKTGSYIASKKLCEMKEVIRVRVTGSTQQRKSVIVQDLVTFQQTELTKTQLTQDKYEFYGTAAKQ